MTNDKTVTISRELAEQIVSLDSNIRATATYVLRGIMNERNPENWTDGLRARLGDLLAAPVVKAATCAQCKASTTDICNQNGCGYLESGNGAPVVEHQDPEAWKHTMHQELGQSRSVLTDSPCNPFGVPGVDYSREYEVTSKPLYDSPPAPVAVVLPERKTVPSYQIAPLAAEAAIGYNQALDDVRVCLDKVKELNQ